VLGNDLDPDGGPLTVAAVNGQSGAVGSAITLTINGVTDGVADAGTGGGAP